MESIADSQKQAINLKHLFRQVKTESGGADNESENNFGLHRVQTA